MNEVRNSTILPFALWLKQAPMHNISAIIYLDKTNNIVSGCEKGHIMVWSINSAKNELTPHYYLISHKSKISNFVLAGSSHNTSMDYFVSFSAEGEIALWEAGEGRNIEFISNPQLNIQHVFSYESTSMKQRIIFCCLKNREIFVLNSMSLSHIYTLRCTSSPHWFSSLTVFSKSPKEDIVMATTVSGLVSMWVLHLPEILDQDDHSLMINSDQCVDLATANPFKVAHNPHCLDLVIVITPYQFKIYHTDAWDILSYHDCRRGDYFIDGDFVHHDSILTHTQSGKSFYYQLPLRANCQHSLFTEKSSNLLENIPILLFEFAEPANMGLLRYKVLVQNDNDKFIIWKGFSNGNLYKWEFPNTAEHCLPLMFNLDKSWSTVKKTPGSLTRSMKDPLSNKVVTSLLFIHDFSLIVLGMENGCIFIRNINDAISCAFLESDLESTAYIRLKGHNGPVTYLLHPSSNMQLPTLMSSTRNYRSNACLNLLKLTHILWSGGADYTIRVWNIKTEQMLNIFNCHSAPIISLKLTSLNSNNVFGFSQGFTEAMFKSINDNEEYSHEIKQMISTCMNSFLVGISDNDGISIISIMKQKLLLYTSEHNSPVHNLGWAIGSGYLLIDTLENNVHVWDLSSGTLDRFETGEKAQMLMENCPIITKIRSKVNNELLVGSKSVRRHSLNGASATDSSSHSSSYNKLVRFQFLDSGEIDRYIPVLIFNLSTLLDCLGSYNQISNQLCEYFSEISGSPTKNCNSPPSPQKMADSGLHTLISDAKSDKQNIQLKILLIKIILSQTDLFSNNSSLNFLHLKSNEISCSFGQVNSKTGCIVFDLKSLFEGSSTNQVNLTMNNMLIQLAISNRIISFAKSPVYDGFLELCSTHINHDVLARRFSLSIPRSSNVATCRKTSSMTIKSFKLHRKAILNVLVLEYLKVLNEEVTDLSFSLLEKIYNRLIFGILDTCDTVSKSALQLVTKTISHLTDQQIQNYILVWRLFLCPTVDIYGLEDGRTFLSSIHPYLDTFIEYSYFSSDWVWWFSKDHIRSEHERRNLSKIQIKALLNIALLGSHLLPEDADKNSDDVKLFSKLFSLDKSFLARITCDFLMLVLSKKPKKSKSNIGRLINLAMICLSNGFVVWEPYFDSNSVIYNFLKFAVDMDDPAIEDKFLCNVSQRAIEGISMVRPSVFVMACYREMLRLQSAAHSGFSGSPSNNHRHSDRRKFHQNSSENEPKVEKSLSLLNRKILLPIFNNLCQTKSETIQDVLPEIVELYVHFYIKEDFHSLMSPILKFSSVSLNEPLGQLCVGSIKGNLFLFDLKIGKYFNTLAHKKSIRITKFSDDAKLLASYSLQENTIKIWQISNQLFSLGSNSYQVKMASSHVIPSVEKMLIAANLNSVNLPVDVVIDKDSDINLEWDSDNKSLFVKFSGVSLRQIKL